jgi:hypothetical protein
MRGVVAIVVVCACGKKISSPPDHAELVERDAHLAIVELPSNTFRKFLVSEAGGAFEVQIGTSDTPKLRAISLGAGSTSVAEGPFAGGHFAVVELVPHPHAAAVSAIKSDLDGASAKLVDGTEVTGAIGSAEATILAVTGLAHAGSEARAKWQPGLAAAFDDHIDQGYVAVFHLPKTDQIVLVVAQIPPRELSMREAQSIFDSFVAPARPDPVN